MDGLINLHKEPGVTCALTLDRLKPMLGLSRVGHAGTLDRFASGVLVALVGTATRQSEAWMAQPKTYLASIKLGARTPTLDPDSPETLVPGPTPSSDELLAACARFRGTIQQVPPEYSALKIDGRRASDLVRAGRAPVLQPRQVTVHELEVTAYDFPRVDIRMVCSRGTYVRAIARDLGAALGSAAYLTSLVRAAIGPLRVEEAFRLADIRVRGAAACLQSPIPPLP